MPDDWKIADAICRRTLVIIPALNEVETLPAVISPLKCWPLAGIRVVDNGSTDETARTRGSVGRGSHPRTNSWIRGGLLERLQNLPFAAEWILFCDADGSDDLWALCPFFEAAAAGHDLVLGNRNSLPQSKRSLTWPQQFGNALGGLT